jgi:hypothetical protein
MRDVYNCKALDCFNPRFSELGGFQCPCQLRKHNAKERQHVTHVPLVKSHHMPSQ